MKLLFKNKLFLGLIDWPLLKEKGGVMNTNVKSQLLNNFNSTL